MKLGIYVKSEDVLLDPRLSALEAELKNLSYDLYRVREREDVVQGSDMVLAIGGDGTFLSASKRVAGSGVPVLGVNLGRVGFLSENKPEDVAPAISSGRYEVEDRAMLKAGIYGCGEEALDFWPFALNEVTVHRDGGALMGIQVTIDGEELPTYWADGLLVATSSGSTAYSLSLGGPICLPASKVLLVVPIAPHNLNVRPLVVPDVSKIEISFHAREGKVRMSLDNRSLAINPSWKIGIQMAQFSLKRVRLGGSNFVKALTSKLFWGEDIRNNR